MDDRTPLSPALPTLPLANEPPARSDNVRSRWWRFAPLAAVLCSLALGYALGFQDYLSVDAIRASHVRLSAFVDANPVAAAAAYIVLYVTAVALSFPGASILTVAGGLMFGWLLGGSLAVVAATAGATIIFLIAKTSIGETLAAHAGPRARRLREGFRDEGFSYLLFLRLVPLFPFWLVNIAAALFGMRLGPYVAGTLIGIMPATFALAFFGQGLSTTIDAEGPSFGTLAAGLALLGFLALVPVAVRRWRGSVSGNPRGET